MKICIIGDAGYINILPWANYMASELSHEIHIITFDTPCEVSPNIKFHMVNGLAKKGKLRYLLNTKRINKIVQGIRPDILIGYRITSYGYLAVKTGFHPVVLVAQGTDLFDPRKSRIKKLFAKHNINKADLVQTFAEHMESKLLDFGAKRENIFVLPKGVDTSVFKPKPVPSEIEKFTIISTRLLRPTYNHNVILKSLPLVLKKMPNFRYLVCGFGEERDRLENICKNLKIDNHVTFMGRILHQNLPFHLQSSDVYVSMQNSDGVSASLLEAMACGVFPIVTDIDANRLWIKDGINGFLVPANDHLRLAEKIIESYENKKLREDATRINISIIEEKASIAKNMERMEKRYRALVEGHIG